MNYALAKELKDAGFLQGHTPCVYPRSMETGEIKPPELTTEMVIDSRAYNPTLSELIAECEPEKFDEFYISLEMDEWIAHVFYVGFFTFNKKHD